MVIAEKLTTFTFGISKVLIIALANIFDVLFIPAAVDSRYNDTTDTEMSSNSRSHGSVKSLASNKYQY